jgi:adenylosuccinate synthase
MIVDFLGGIRYGDEGKGKLAAELAKSGVYTHTMRFNGSHNAGHTIYVNGRKIVTHIVPTGAIFGLPSVIGPGCVVHEADFISELDELLSIQPNIHALVKVAKNTHIVTDAHRQEEQTESKIGTTRKGVGPCYRDKYARIGRRAETSAVLEPYLVDMNEWVEQNASAVVLAEGAQAMGLDIDSEEYPYVTSSHCGVGALINNGIPHTAIRKVIGVAKAYDTYVGARSFQDKSDPTLDLLGDLGHEYGATTGRRRQCNYLDIDHLSKIVRRMGVTDLLINKMDVLRQANVWKLKTAISILQFDSEEAFANAITDSVPNTVSITLSDRPDRI